MLCPFCQHDETKVIDSRTSQDFSIRRRRQCLQCERRFTTYERIEESPVKVVKKDGSRIPFDRAKIRFGIEKACYKRPVSDQQIDQLPNSSGYNIYQGETKPIDFFFTGRHVYRWLRTIHKLLYYLYYQF